MHLDKKLIIVIAVSALMGGIIGGGIGGAIGSFASNEEGVHGHERWGEEHGRWQREYKENDNDEVEGNNTPQSEQAPSMAQPQAQVTSTSTVAK